MALGEVPPIKIKTRSHFIILLIMLIILGLGWYCSIINFLGKEWFSRSGSLVVILGIILGFSGIIQERLLISRLEIRKRIQLLQKKRQLRQQSTEKSEIEQELENIKSKFVERTNELTGSMKFNIGLIEGVLLIVGTLIWGFGDLVFLVM